MATTVVTSSPSLPSATNQKNTNFISNSPTQILKLATTLNQTKQIHSQILKSQMPCDISSSLIASYSNLSTPLSLHYAITSFHYFQGSRAFNFDSKSILFALNILIRGFSQLGFCQKAILLYASVLDFGKVPDKFTFPPLFAGLVKNGFLDEGIQLHGALIKVGIEGDYFTDNSLIHFYSEFGDMESALQVFDKMHNKNVVSWTSLIDGYVKAGKPQSAISLFDEMVEENLIKPNAITMACVVSACAKLQDIKTGEKVCAYITDSGIGFNVHLVSALIDMYMKCGEVKKAEKLFSECIDRSIVAWNTMITNYARLGLSSEALWLFNEMLVSGPICDRMTIVAAISASAQLGRLNFGKRLHGYIIRNNLHIWEPVSNSVIDMYMKCSDPDAAFRVFEMMLNRTEASWNTIISGCMKNGDFDLACRYFDIMPVRDLYSWNTMLSALVEVSQFEKAIILFRSMQSSGIEPDEVTMVCVSSACGYLGALDLAKWIYAYVKKKEITKSLKLCTSLVDMFAKCGDSKSAMKIFQEMPVKDVSAWTAAIGSVAVEGNGIQALKLFRNMIAEGVKPDSVVFVEVLTALSHGGLVQEGREFFDSMTKTHGFYPEVVHYGCMVDLLGRAGLLEEAQTLIENMKIEPNDVIWGALLAACRIHKNIKLAEYAAKKVYELAPERTGIHVLLSNAYASVGKWSDVARVRLNLKDRGMKKLPGSSLIEVDGEMHEFTSSNESHPQMNYIAKMVDEMSERLLFHGYVSNLAAVLLNVDKNEKEFLLSRHSEKMAVAFGLISTAQGVKIHVVKNLRICRDCHEFMKLVSAIYSRDITIRDNSRFHHFREGKCSCNDYW